MCKNHVHIISVHMQGVVVVLLLLLRVVVVVVVGELVALIIAIPSNTTTGTTRSEAESRFSFELWPKFSKPYASNTL